MKNKILCFLFGHKWKYYPSSINAKYDLHTCSRCKKREYGWAL